MPFSFFGYDASRGLLVIIIDICIVTSPELSAMMQVYEMQGLPIDFTSALIKITVL